MTKALIDNKQYEYDLCSLAPIIFGDPKQGYKVEYEFIGTGKLLSEKEIDILKMNKLYFFYKEKKKFNLYGDTIVDNELSSSYDRLLKMHNFISINDFKDLLKEYKYKHNSNKDCSKLLPSIYKEVIKTHRHSRNIRSFTLSEHVDKDAIEISVFEVRDLFLHYGEVPFKIDLGFDDLVNKGLLITFNVGSTIRFKLSNVVLKVNDENS